MLPAVRAMAFEAPKATPQGMEHRYGQFRIVTILDQFLNDLSHCWEM